jgi:transposase
VLAASLYVLRTGCAWSALPASFGVSTPTAHRRFTEWVEGDVFVLLHQIMLDLLGSAGAIDWSRASVDGVQVREAIVDAVALVKGPSGRPRRRPRKLHADKGYDYPACRKALCRWGIIARIARRGVELPKKLGCYRYVIEWTLSGFPGSGGWNAATNVRAPLPWIRPAGLHGDLLPPSHQAGPAHHNNPK